MSKKKVLILCLILYTQQSLSFIDFTLNIDEDIWKFTEKLTQSSEQSKESQMYVSTQLEKLKDLTDKSPNEIMIMEGLEALQNHSAEMDRYFEHICEHLKHHLAIQGWDNTTAEKIEKIPAKIDGLRNLLIPNISNQYSHPGLLMKIAQMRAASVDDSCDQTRTTQYFLLSILDRVLLAELKSIAIMSIDNFYTKAKSWNKAKTQARKDFEERFSMYLTAGIDAMKIVHQGAVKGCEPPNGWIRDETYFEMEGLEHPSWFISEAFEEDVCYDNHPWHPADECHGVLRDCKRTSVLLACLVVTNSKLKINSKRWQWIKTEESHFGPISKTCNSGKGDFFSSMSEGDPFNCLCSCSSNNKASVSLGLSLSNVTDNKVITGIRFRRENKTLYIQIQEGKLQPKGQIDRNSRIWVPLPTDSPMTYLNHTYKTFILSDLIVPLGYVFVGVQFVNDSKIALRAIGQKFDYEKGILLPITIEIPTKQEAEYDKLRFVSVSSVYGENLFHKPDSDKHYVELGQSTWESDVGQSVLPLFDGISVVTDPPTPLGGIGLFHKGVEGYAGFISMRLHSLPYRLYLERMLRNHKPGRVLDECRQPSCSFDDIFDLVEKVHHFMKRMIETEKRGSDQLVKKDSIFKKNRTELAVDFNYIMQKLDDLSYYMRTNDLIALIKNATRSFLPTDIEREIEKFPERISWIDFFFNRLTNYSKENSGYAGFRMGFFIYSAFSGERDQLEKWILPSLKLSESGTGLIEFIAQKSAIFAGTQCIGSWSIQHVLTQIFRIVIVTEIKAMVTLSASCRGHVPDPTRECKWTLWRMRDDFKDRFMRYVKAFAKAMQIAPKYVEACDYKSDAVASDETYFAIDSGIQPLLETNIAISLAPSHANLSANQVVTGLRFVLQNNTLHIQIKQGKLLPNGWIDAASQSWVPLPNRPKKMIRHMDISKFFLSNITFPPEYAVVGVKFVQTYGFSIEATAQRFDFSTGKLLSREKRIFMKRNNIHANLSHLQDSEDNWTKLGELSENTDSSVQLRFEALPVEVLPPTPLRGMEFYHKSSGNHSELISLRLFTSRYEENLRDFIEKGKRNGTFVDI